MAEGPYRHVEIVEARGPRGIAFVANDEGLSVEVKRTLPALVAGATLVGGVAAFAVTSEWSNLVVEAAVAGNVGYWIWPRLRRTNRLTSIDIRGGVARFLQLGWVGRDERTVPLNRLGFPVIGKIVIARSRLPDVRLRCLQFDHYVDGVRGGQSLPLQMLAGYRLESLEWLCTNIGAWMSTVGGLTK